MRKFGLAAILTFVDKGATAAMGRVGTAAKKLQKRFRGIGAGVAQFGRGLGTLATAAIPFTGAVGLMIKTGAKFEQSIANLSAKMLDKFDPALKSLARTLGATTVFSASQAADAMTELAKAGLGAEQIMGAVPGVLAAASAENIPLAQSASIVADTLNQFKLNAKDAGAVANTLALASVNANTNMSGLAEGLKLAGPVIKTVGGNLTDTVAILGSLADVGLKGTTAGTALRAGISNLIDPNKKAKKAIAALGLSIGDVQKLLKAGKVGELMQTLAGRLGDIDDGGKRAQLALRLFGKRAVPLAIAISKNKDNADKFSKSMKRLSDEFKSGGSAADKMARKQLDTLIGQSRLAKSAVEDIAISLNSLVAKELRAGAEGLVKTFSNLALALRVVGGEKFVDPKVNKQIKGISETIFDVARGIRLGIGEAKVALKGIFSTLGSVGKAFGFAFGETGAKGIAKMVTKFITLAAVLAPVALGFLAITKVAGGMKDVVVGGLKATVGVARVAGDALGGVAGLLGKRLPILGKIFGGVGGFVGKAAKAAEKVTARPVRVVNFDEIGGIGGAAGAAGAGPFIGPIQQLPGLFTRARLSVNRFAARIPKVGGLLSSSLTKAGFAAASLGTKLGAGGLILAAGGLGVAFGTLIDRTFGLSDKISSFFFDREKDLRERITGPLKTQLASLEQTGTLAKQVGQLLTFRKKGITAVGVEGGRKREITRGFAQERIVEQLRRSKVTEKEIAIQMSRIAPLLAKLPVSAQKPAQVTKPKPAKDALVSASGLMHVSPGDVVLDRASLAGAVVSQLRGGLRGRAGGGALGGGGSAQTSPPPAASGGPLRIEIPVTIDGRQIALAVAEIQLDDLERSGASLKAGDRSAMLQRGFRDEV